MRAFLFACFVSTLVMGTASWAAFASANGDLGRGVGTGDDFGFASASEEPDEAWGFEPEYETKEEIEALNREAAEGLVTESFEEDEEEGPRQTRHPDDRYIQVPHPNPNYRRVWMPNRAEFRRLRRAFERVRFAYAAKPAFVDMDEDGDLDVLVGSSSGRLRYFENDNFRFRRRTHAAFTHFEGLRVQGYASPTFAQLSGAHPAPDLVLGSSSGGLSYLQRGPAGYSGNVLSPLRLIYDRDNRTPVFADIDKDGDEDLIIGTTRGRLRYYRKVGPWYNARYRRVGRTSSPFRYVNVGKEASPVFIDADSDGDLDLFVGNKRGHIHFYRNIRGTYRYREQHPYKDVSVGGYGGRAAPAFFSFFSRGKPRTVLVVGTRKGRLVPVTANL